MMKDIKCLKEKLPDMVFSFLLAGIGLFFSIIGFLVLPIIGFIVAFMAILWLVPALAESFNPACVYRDL